MLSDKLIFVCGDSFGTLSWHLCTGYACLRGIFRPFLQLTQQFLGVAELKPNFTQVFDGAVLRDVSDCDPSSCS
jgi:hypothetical protein